MNLLEILNSPAAATAPSWRGTWARIWLQPSIFSAQRFIVGLVILDDQGVCDFRFITGTEKFECVYGEAGRELVDKLITQGRQALGNAREKHLAINATMMPPGLFIDLVGMASDQSVERAIESVLTEAEIPMEPRPEMARAPRFKSRLASEVVRDAVDAIKARIGIKADQILREDHFGDEKHVGKVNLVLPDAAGIVASGWYVGSDRVQLELLKSVNMVESYMHMHNKKGEAGVFLLRPTVEDGLNPKQSQEIDNALDQLDYFISSRGMRMTTRNQKGDIADDVAEWAQM